MTYCSSQILYLSAWIDNQIYFLANQDDQTSGKESLEDQWDGNTEKLMNLLEGKEEIPDDAVPFDSTLDAEVDQKYGTLSIVTQSSKMSYSVTKDNKFLHMKCLKMYLELSFLF